MASPKSHRPPAPTSQPRAKHIGLGDRDWSGRLRDKRDRLRLISVKTRYPSIYNARVTGAVVFEAGVVDSHVPNTDVASVHDVPETLIRQWRSGAEKVGLGEVCDLEYRLAMSILHEAIDYVRWRRHASNDNAGHG